MFKVLGLEINFPFNPYNIQKAMMNKLVLTFTNHEHSIIESPTGTGKTLVLLCSALAWRQKSVELGYPFISPKYTKKKQEERIKNLKNKPCTCGRRPEAYQNDKSDKDMKKCGKNDLNYDYDEIDEQKNSAKRLKVTNTNNEYFKTPKAPIAETEIIVIDDDDDDKTESKPAGHILLPKLDLHRHKVDDDNDDCATQIYIVETKPSTVETKPDIVETANENKPVKNIETQDMCKSCKAIDAEDCFFELMDPDNNELFTETNKPCRIIPKIYYGTRTHKQITQVVRELNKTCYCKDIKMCILSSRDRTCIREDIRDLPGRNDKCKELISNARSKSKQLETCSYYSTLKQDELIFTNMHKDFSDKAWDIEDAANYGKQIGACPYFGLRELMRDSSIVFCPYNYLLDPSIRKVMDINLKNSIIIFDEAHNIEDICRDSASFTITSRQIDEILERAGYLLNQLLPDSKVYEAVNYFRFFFMRLARWLTELDFTSNSTGGDNKFEKSVKHFKGHDKEEILSELEIGEKHLDVLIANKNSITKSDDDEAQSAEKDKNADKEDNTVFEGTHSQLIIQLTITLCFMYNSKKKFYDDFELVATKQLELNKSFNRGYGNQNRNREDAYIYEFNLLCMNSAVSFERIKTDAWSVVVASGTLSPLESLRTELGVSFEYTFEGGHMIGRDRVFASIIPRGPKNVDVNCAWKNTNTLQVQDEIGSVISKVCETVPNGILCFFPSYDRMETFFKRWAFTKVIQDIKRSGKQIFRETKDLSAENFDRELVKYRDSARLTGAILMAVFRGKVSEGIDFSDEDARAVITIGIPYPNIKDVGVNLKKDYNDSKNRGQVSSLLNGREWYSAQAFRALNQALGRCIRHKNDWGAILMLDSRLLSYNATDGISKWIRQHITRSNDFNDTYSKLKEFVQYRRENN